MRKKKWMYLGDDESLYTEGCGCCTNILEPSETTLVDLNQLEATLRDQLERVGVRIGILRAAAFALGES